MAKLLTGKEVTEKLEYDLAESVKELKAKGITPTLATVRCGENPSDISYEKGAIKRAEAVGVLTRQIVLSEDSTKEELLKVIDELNEDDSVHGVLLFRPLPDHLRKDQYEIENRLRTEKDIDCMTELANGGVYIGNKVGFPPCTAQACLKILEHYDIDPKGKNVVVIGRSLVVGRPTAMLLMNEKNATVTICHTKTVDVQSIAKKADILITSAGVLNSITKDFVSEGQIVIDVSINWDQSKKEGKGGIAGDAVFDEVEPIVAAITPVPGGVGAVTTAMLISHVVTAAKRTINIQ